MNEEIGLTDESAKEIDLAREIAESIVVLGPDLRNLSDSELIDRINKMTARLSIAFNKMSATIDEATKAFNALGKAARKIEWDTGA